MERTTHHIPYTKYAEKHTPNFLCSNLNTPETTPTSLPPSSDFFSDNDWIFTMHTKSNTSTTPETRRQMLHHPNKDKFIAAEIEELDSLQRNGVYRKVKREPWMNVIGSRWVYAHKTVPEERHRSRLVSQGFKQKHGIDYEETYSPVMATNTLRWCFAMTALHDWATFLMDIKTAYQNSDLPIPIYMFQPPGHNDNTDNI